jgi:hypothetical protein
MCPFLNAQQSPKAPFEPVRSPLHCLLPRLPSSLIMFNAANGHNLQIANGELVYGGSLQVEFQSCQPNFGHFDGNNGIPVGGMPLASLIWTLSQFY